MKKSIEIGDKIGLLTVIEHLGVKNKNNTYLCECDCGKTREVRLTRLLNKKVNSCGCKNFIYNSHGNRKYSPKESSFRAKVANYKAHSKRRGIDFKLSVNKAIELLKQKCFYCKKLPMNSYNVRIRNGKSKYLAEDVIEYNILYNGIDRKDNMKGYTIENSVTCCVQCNTAKLNFTVEEFREWIKDIYFNFIKNEEK